MKKYNLLTRAELLSHQNENLNNLAEASNLPEASPDKETLLQYYSLQKQAIDKEFVNRDQRPTPPVSIWKTIASWFTVKAA